MQRYDHGGDIYGGGISLDFSVNTNPLGMPEAVRRAVIENVQEYSRYPDPQCRELRSALSLRQGVPENIILCGNGAAGLIMALCACVKPRETLVTAPTFSDYERAAALYGGSVAEHPLPEGLGFALTDDILQSLTPNTELLVLCSPNNPTGRLAAPELLEKIAKACLENGTLLLLDECFIEFTAGRSMLSRLNDFPNLLVLQAFTKIYAIAGLRLGTLYCSNDALLSRIAEHMPTWSVSGVAQKAGLAALTEAGWIENTSDIVAQEREFMAEALRALGIKVYDSDANFLLLQSDLPLYELLRERGILVRNCGNFTGLDERYIRIGLKTRDKNEALLRSLEKII